ncbi:MAG: Acetyl-CoA carboxylase carboxyl transferase subunit beta [Acidimicrobiales bacterium]|nr:Acetyl-CoA carboxylase carboxyl transferase subunit beta [Acidimicrobiales bacterium]
MPPHPTQVEWDRDLRGDNPLDWPDYKAPDTESVVTGRTEHYAFAEGRFDVMGGSMGAVHGEKVVRAYRRAAEERLPMVVLPASGGARMQEGMISLIQMARTSSAAATHARAGLLSLALLRSPTTGGVYASYASLADLRAAEPGATIGFAGPRVVELMTGAPLPAGSHTAESAYEDGLVDAVTADGTAWLEAGLGLRDIPLPPRRIGGVLGHTTFDDSAWGQVEQARLPFRASGIDWAARLCSSWTELAGTDPVIRAGLATLEGGRLVVVAMDRHAADGRPQPAGYRLAQRAIALAGRLSLPLLTLVDTPGADPSATSEADGIAGEIARTFAAMADLPSTSVSVCVGEGGSGGALALAHSDRLLMQEHAVFSVIAPEGAAAILERDTVKAPDLATRLKLTSADLLGLGIVDAVVPEPDPVALRTAVVAALSEAGPGDRNRRIDAATARWIH